MTAEDKAQGANPINPQVVGLPLRPFLYTMDQVAQFLSVTEEWLKKSGTIYYYGRSSGVPSPDRIKAHDIAPPDHTPEWRVSEQEITRWMKRKHFKVYTRSWVAG